MTSVISPAWIFETTVLLCCLSTVNDPAVGLARVASARRIENGAQRRRLSLSRLAGISASATSEVVLTPEEVMAIATQ